MNSRILKFARRYHKWPALVISFFLIMFSLSGIVMNHRGITSKIDVKRSILPDSYQLRNWNLASVKSSLIPDDGSRIIYGNSGIWKCDSLNSSFIDLNRGLDKGMDNRKVRSVVQMKDGTLLAGAFSGLYLWNKSTEEWQKIVMPVKSERIQDLQIHDSIILIVTRSEIIRYRSKPDDGNSEVIILGNAKGERNTVSLFRLFWIMHSGEIIGIAGTLILDLVAIIILFLVFTGLIHFFFPKKSEWLRKKIKNLPELRRKNLLLHNKTGAWFFVLLLFVPFTGMFLRPPFLITIANARISVPEIFLKVLKNPWDDKLRAIVWSSELDAYILSTSEGFYSLDADLKEAPRAFSVQPPVSVMGINVFSPAGSGNFYVGSFDGLFLWNPLSEKIYDMLPLGEQGRSRGNSHYLISGMLTDKGKNILFDYDIGELSGAELFPLMPDNIKASSPMPLWNVAQEIHTARIYQPFLGLFYILIVPLIALSALLVFVTGYIRWRKLYRKK